ALEAWRYGRPAAVSRGTGVAEVVTEGLNGAKFRPGDAEGLARILDRLVRDGGRADRMGEAGRASLRGFDAPAGARRERRILQEAIADFGGTSHPAARRSRPRPPRRR
ncbi:MAG: glycosyltransferase, partial [Halobacteriales archaeon]|nr:glycosyltransferase [Halobacteriales archaeon]